MDMLIDRSWHLLPTLRYWYAIPLRLIMGIGFVEQSQAKPARGPEPVTGTLHALGAPGSPYVHVSCSPWQTPSLRGPSRSLTDAVFEWAPTNRPQVSPM